MHKTSSSFRSISLGILGIVILFILFIFLYSYTFDRASLLQRSREWLAAMLQILAPCKDWSENQQHQHYVGAN